MACQVMGPESTRSSTPSSAEGGASSAEGGADSSAADRPREVTLENEERSDLEARPEEHYSSRQGAPRWAFAPCWVQVLMFRPRLLEVTGTPN